MLKFEKLTFLGPYIKKEPFFHKKQLALVGRSNVGKSSLINHLCNKKNVAKVSSKPGKTQSILFFKIDDTSQFLVDLPGYGFAKVSKKIKEGFSDEIKKYFEEQKDSLLVLLLLDVRHLPSNKDTQMIEWLNYYQIPYIIVFTKSDKLKKKDIEPQTKAIFNSFVSFNPISYVHYSIKDAKCRKILIHQINQFYHGTTS